MLRRWRGADLAGIAVLTLNPSGLVVSWSVTAERLFGQPALEAVGRHACDVLLSGPGQRQLLGQALAEVASGRVWTAIVPVSAPAGGSRVTLHFEPIEGPGSGALVIARRASPMPGQDVLAEAASMIGTSLDLDRTAREVAEVAVPGFADAAAIFISERLLATDELGPHFDGPTAVVRRLAIRLAGRSDEAAEKLLRPGEVLAFGTSSPSYRAMSTRSPVLFDQFDDETAERIERRPGGQEITAGYSSFLAVPLVARGLVLGCATFARMDADQGFGPADIRLAGELAARAAVSIDNARLYHRERRTAFALQQGLLPSEPGQPVGMAVAHRYVPVGASVVGGDWHDIVSLPSGRTALIVGDAMGHGPEAAAVMVQLRTAAHTLADLELPPEEILSRLDRMAAGMPSAPFATCIAAVVDPAAGTGVIARAGHLPPMLSTADGKTRMLDLPPGLPLGLGTGIFSPVQLSLPPGSTLALYTDGLVESRKRSLDDGIAALGDALSAALAQPDLVLDKSCQAVTQALRERGEDDITLVLARVLPQAELSVNGNVAARCRI
ncbi:MAG TPA: SpoIIE family protein phosphatase [Streptosporangiaceae bacterium]|nr:SpoIIE family protein phosphatase [Streptosporangiaceae bacterium]